MPCDIIHGKKVRDVPHGKKMKSDSTYKMINKTSLILKEDGEVLAIFIKGAITDPKMIEAGRGLLKYKKKTTNRGMASGMKADWDTKRMGGNFGGANPVDSSIVGFFETSGFYQCRQTALYRDNLEHFDTETLPLIEYLSSKVFKKLAPDHYAKQLEFISKINQRMRLGDSVYTTITVNVDFRTFSHCDSGDFSSGLGNLFVFKVGDYSGGELLLPNYKMSLCIEEGDILLFDVHETHCNNPIKGKGRISLVCYAREGIMDKCKKTTNKELADNAANKYASGRG
jgi:hypothetical protein